MSQLTANQVHVDVPLTNLTVAHMQTLDSLIADKIFPQVRVAKKSDKYYIWDRAQFNRVGQVQPRAPRTEAARTGMVLSQDSYNMKVYSHGTDFDPETLANADDQLSLRSSAVSFLSYMGLLDREVKFMDAFLKSGVWTTEWTGTTNAANDTAIEFTQWDDFTNSEPVKEVRRAKTAMQLKSGGFRPNVGVISRDVLEVLVEHPDFISRINGGATTGQPAVATKELVQSMFELDELWVVDTVINTSPVGIAESNQFIATKLFAMFYRPPAAGLMVPAVGYTFTWSALEYANEFGVNIQSFTGDFLTIQGIAEVLEFNMAYDFKVVSPDMGVFFNSVIS